MSTGIAPSAWMAEPERVLSTALSLLADQQEEARRG